MRTAPRPIGFTCCQARPSEPRCPLGACCVVRTVPGLCSLEKLLQGRAPDRQPGYDTGLSSPEKPFKLKQHCCTESWEPVKDTRVLKSSQRKQLAIHRSSSLTIFQFLHVPGLNKIWSDILKPPEEFSNKNHNVRLEEKNKKAKDIVRSLFTHGFKNVCLIIHYYLQH